MYRIVSLFFLLTTSSLWAQPKIEVKSYVKIEEGDRIHLADIAKLKGFSAKDSKILSGIDLGKAPTLGEQRILSSETISKALRRQGAVIERNQVTPVIPHQTIIENRGFELGREVVEKKLKSQWATLCLDCTFDIKNISIPAMAKSLQGRPWSLLTQPNLPHGSFSLQLQVQGENGRPQIYWVSGTAAILKKVPVLTRAVPIGHRLKAEDIELTIKDTTFAYDTVPQRDQLVGQLVRQAMRAGDILWKQTVRRDLALHRGDIVRVVSTDDLFEVSLIGVAEQDGYVGDTVKVRNRQSKKIMVGQVIGRGEVRLQ